MAFKFKIISTSLVITDTVTLEGLLNVPIVSCYFDSVALEGGEIKLYAISSPVIQALIDDLPTIVTDSFLTTFNAIVAGGGTNVVPVFYNGTNWVIG